MKEKKAEQEKIIVIDIKLTKGLVVALSCVLVIVGLLAYLVLTGTRAMAAEVETAQAASTGMRQFYLTDSYSYDGSEVLTACAAGYHMASIWEIADPSNLKYNTSLGMIQSDSGQGPVTGWSGWVRTGFYSTSNYTSGQANCNAWSTTEATGSLAALSANWANEPDFGVWNVGFNGCSAEQSVWCVED